MKRNIILLYGGVSGEHEVSCLSAYFVEQKLIEAGHQVCPVYIAPDGQWRITGEVSRVAGENHGEPCVPKFSREELEVAGGATSFRADFVFPIIHGTTGEDGKLQGLLEFYDIAYAGCSVLASALCMDKIISRRIFREAGILQPEFLDFYLNEWESDKSSIQNKIRQGLTFPVFIKPANLGSSVGITKCKDAADLAAALEIAFSFDDRVICEQGIDARELEVSILGNFPDYDVAGPGEVIVHHEFYSYEAKYLDENGADLVLSADVSDALKQKIHAIAKQGFLAVRGDGFARIDFFLDKSSNDLYLNEINTLPGFTHVSMFSMLWNEAGINGATLLDKIVTLGIRSHQGKRKQKRSR